MLRSLLCIGLLATASFVMAAGNTSADDITGVWQTKSGGYVEIYKDGSVYDGKVVGSSDGVARFDKNNPDQAKKGRRLLGVDILQGLTHEGDGSYDDGSIYDPDNGKTYKANAQLTGPDTLDARGYVGISLLGKTQTWTRIDPSAEHVHQDLLEQPVGAKPQSQ